MVDTQVLGKQSTPPAYQTTDGLVDALSAWAAQLLTNTVFLRLFSNDVGVAPDTPMSDLVETQVPGYAEYAVTTLDGPFVDPQGNAYLVTPRALFTTSGGGADLIYGAYLVEVTGAAATVTFTLASGAYTAPVITSGGSGYTYTPLVTVTGATGSGAKLTATVTNGVVTGITIVSPGTGYTTVTASIQPPCKMIYVANFAAPLPLQDITDAIPVVFELDELVQVAA